MAAACNRHFTGVSFERLIDFLASHASPLDHLQQKAAKHRSHFIQKMSSNDVGSGNVIKQIFQEIYLGQNLFKATYNLPANTDTGEGLITRETLLIEPAVFPDPCHGQSAGPCHRTPRSRGRICPGSF